MRKGFTLIELLVVVAIIAILASIALYNFMGAQTRAKISKAKGELRTIVTALESYYVDNNSYPTYHYVTITEFYLGGWANTIGDIIPFDGANPLTTPIPYISTMPNDPFYNKSDADPFERRNYGYVNWDQACYIYPNQIFYSARMKFGNYRIHSLGPDKDGPDTGIPYDPSNGYFSNGDVYYSPLTGFDTPVDVGS
jgi:prepilin-type N-terminal cleavage/methylation domain-containing protein